MLDDPLKIWFSGDPTLRKKYTENIDFKEIKSNDDLVKIYESLNANQSSFKKSSHKRGTIKKYYAVTGETIIGLSRTTVHYTGSLPAEILIVVI